MELRTAVLALRRRWWVPVLLVLVGVILAALATSSPKTYRSRAVVAITPPAGATVTGDRYVTTQLAVLESNRVVDPVATALGLSTEDLSDQVAVSQQPGSNLAIIAAEERSPSRAELVVKTYAETYVTLQRGSQRTDVQPQIDTLNGQIANLEQSLTLLSNDIASATAAYIARTGDPANVPPASLVAPEPAALQQLRQQQYNQLVTERDRLILTADFNSAAVVEPFSPAVPTRRRSPAYIAAAALLGLALGAAVALLSVEYSRYSLSDERTSAVLGAPLVGQLRFRGRGRAGPGGLTADADVLGILAARARTISSRRGQLRIAVLGSHVPSETHDVALAVGKQFAAAGEHVAVLDCRPELHGSALEPVLSTDTEEFPSSLHTFRLGTPDTAARGGTDAALAQLGWPGVKESAEVTPRTDAYDVVILDAGTVFSSGQGLGYVEDAHCVLLVLDAKPRLDVLARAAAILDAYQHRLVAVKVSFRGAPAWRQPAREETASRSAEEVLAPSATSEALHER